MELNTAAAAFELDPKDHARTLGQAGGANGRVAIDAETVEQDLARLSAFEKERLGTTLMRTETAFFDVAEKFGVGPDDLSLDLGPLGKPI